MTPRRPSVAIATQRLLPGTIHDVNPTHALVKDSLRLEHQQGLRHSWSRDAEHLRDELLSQVNGDPTPRDCG
jgi:hypothetical protein